MIQELGNTCDIVWVEGELSTVVKKFGREGNFLEDPTPREPCTFVEELCEIEPIVMALLGFQIQPLIHVVEGPSCHRPLRPMMLVILVLLQSWI